MDSDNDTGIFTFAGTAGVNDEVRRKEEAEIRDIETTMKRTRENMQREGSASVELKTSEKHTIDEAREMLQAAKEQRNTVDVDCGTTKALVSDVISACLKGSDISDEARQEGTKGITEAALVRSTVLSEGATKRKERMSELGPRGKQNTLELGKLNNVLVEIASVIKREQQAAEANSLESKLAAMKLRTQKMQSVKANLAKDLENLQNQEKKIMEQSRDNVELINAKTAARNEAKTSNSKLVAELTKKQNDMCQEKSLLEQDIDRATVSMTTLQTTLAKLNDQFAEAQWLLRERSKLEEEVKSVRNARNELASRKKCIETELETEEKRLRDADTKTKDLKLMEQNLAVSKAENDKLDQENPSTRLEKCAKELEAANNAFKDLQKARASTTGEQIKEAHAKRCDVERTEAKLLSEELIKERSKNEELVNKHKVPDPKLLQMKAELLETKSQKASKEKRIDILKKKAFDNRGHQKLVRKYKVLKAARKLCDLESSCRAKIGKLATR